MRSPERTAKALVKTTTDVNQSVQGRNLEFSQKVLQQLFISSQKFRLKITYQASVQRQSCQDSLRRQWCSRGDCSLPCSAPQIGSPCPWRKRNMKRCRGGAESGTRGGAAWAGRRGPRCRTSMKTSSQLHPMHFPFLLMPLLFLLVFSFLRSFCLWPSSFG